MLYDIFIAPFADYAFMQRALAGGIAVSLGAAPVGVFMMLRRMSLIGDAMAHAILPGVAAGYLLSGLSLAAMTAGGLATGLVVALVAGLVARSTILKEDASFAAFHLIALALGVTLVSLKGSNVDLLHVLFGSVLALDNDAVSFLAVTATITLAALALIYRPLVMESVDPLFLRSVSRTGGLAHIGFLMLAVLNMVAGFHALGTLMAVGMMMIPAAAARFWSNDVAGLLAGAVIVALASSVAGLLLSYHLSLPSGPAIVLMAGAFYILSLAAGRVGGVLPRLVRPHHLEA